MLESHGDQFQVVGGDRSDRGSDEADDDFQAHGRHPVIKRKRRTKASPLLSGNPWGLLL